MTTTGTTRLLAGLATGAAIALVATACSVPDAGASGAGHPGASGAVRVPLTGGPSPYRAAAEVEVGGARLRVLVDTGSVGLRVLASRVPAGTTAAGPAPPQSYGSGVSLTGTVARVPVGIGGRDAVVPVELVTGVGCVPSRPGCPAAAGGTPEAFGGGFDGILGIGTNAVPQVPNPLWYFGPVGHAFAVRYSGGGGELVLGEPATGYAEEHLAGLPRPADPADGPPAWRPAVGICIAAAPLPGGRTCGPTLIDTGTSDLALVDPQGPSGGVLDGSTPLVVGSATGGWSADYLAGQDGRARVAPRPTGSPGSVVGLPAFAHLDVRFDLDAGTVGIRPH